MNTFIDNENMNYMYYLLWCKALIKTSMLQKYKLH